MANKIKKKVSTEVKVETKGKEQQVGKKIEKKVDNVVKLHAKDYRKRARDIVNPMKGDFAVVYFVYASIIGALGAITSGISMIDPIIIDWATGKVTGTGTGLIISSALGSAFTLLTAGAIAFSRIYLVKQAHSAGEKPKVGGLFYGFKERYTQSLGVTIIRDIFITLWGLLLIVPGIIKSLSYSMAIYIAFDNPNKSTLDCITESRKVMYGHKWQLFCMRFSYIGWIILCILTLGILSFWVDPKIEQANYEFYLHITNKDK